VNDLEITAVIKDLSRPHPSGGVVIERAAILAAGADSPEIIDWIMSHSGTPENSAARGRGLHGSRGSADQSFASTHPTRFILPANTLQ
jgi:hypothetical protein